MLYRILEYKRSTQVEIIHTDTSFVKKWSGFIPVSPDLFLRKQYYHNSRLSLLFQSVNTTDANFYLYQVNMTNGNYTRFVVRNLIPFAPTHFECTDMGAIIGGYFIRVPIVLFFSTSNLQARILPGLFNEPGELTQISVNDDNSFDVLIGAKNFNRQRTLWLKSYSPAGDLDRNLMLDPGPNNSLLFGRAIKDEHNNELIAGVYGARNSEFSRGLFIARISDDGTQQVQYYNYADLENFFKYMRARREQRVKERIARKKIKGKKIRFSYRFLVHELTPYRNQFIFLGEAFYPRYRSAQTGTFGPGGRTTMVFDGYQYTHAVVLGINKEGNLIWDNSFQINDVKTFTLEQFVKMAVRPDDIGLLYVYKNEIRSKIIHNNTVLEGNTYNQLEQSGMEQTINVEVSRLDYWYPNTFFTSGIKAVPAKNGRGRQRIFYLSKIVYR